MNSFSSSQLQVLEEIIKLDSKKQYSKIVLVNLLEILRCNCELEVCSKSKRFKSTSASDIESIQPASRLEFHELSTHQ